MKSMPEKFNRKLIQHKKLIGKMLIDEDKNMLVPIDRSSSELILVYADFKCEGCRTEKDLQCHHLLNKSTRKYTDKWKYLSQRHYWSNILLLCKNCHAEIERRPGGLKNNSRCIPQDVIDKVKKKYEE